MSVGDILSDGQVICYLEEKTDYSICVPVKLEDVEIAKVYGDKTDTAMLIKLRVQNQLGILANRVKVMRDKMNYHYASHIDEGATVHVDESVLLQDKALLGRSYIFLTLIDPQRERYSLIKVYKKVPKKTTVRELKKMIVQLFCKNVTNDICLFVTKDETKYVKIGPNLMEVPIAEILSDGHIVCYIEDKREHNRYWLVRKEKVEIGKVFGELEDTARTMKLRIQDQLGIPVSCVTITRMAPKYKGGPVDLHLPAQDDYSMKKASENGSVSICLIT